MRSLMVPHAPPVTHKHFGCQLDHTEYDGELQYRMFGRVFRGLSFLTIISAQLTVTAASPSFIRLEFPKRAAARRRPGRV
jgi:hypothetical protein